MRERKFFLLNFFMRGVSAVAAAVYTLLVIGISYLTVPTESITQALPPHEDMPASSTNTTTVDLLQNREEIRLELQQAIDLYMTEMPDSIRFSVQTVSNESDYHSTLRSRLLSGDEVDLFHISGAREAIELEKHLSDLSSLTWIDKAEPIVSDTVKRGDKVYGLPYSIEGFGFVCNRLIFEDAEIDISEIQSFEALSYAFAELKSKIESGELSEDFIELEAVCELAVQDKSFLSKGFADIALTEAFKSSEDVSVADSITFPAANPVEELIKLMARHSSSSGNWAKLAEMTDARQIERFTNGRVAVILGDSDVYRQINEINPDMQGKAFLLPVPLDTFEHGYVYVGAPSYWAINEASEQAEKNAADRFLEWLYRSEAGTTFFAENFRAVSPFTDTSKSTGAVLHSQMLSYLRADMAMPRLYNELPQSWSKNIFVPNVQSYFIEREKTWDDVIASCVEGWNPDT